MVENPGNHTGTCHSMASYTILISVGLVTFHQPIRVGEIAACIPKYKCILQQVQGNFECQLHTMMYIKENKILNPKLAQNCDPLE